MLVDDVLEDPRYIPVVDHVRSELVVPLRRKKRVIGALNLLSPTPGQYSERDEAILKQFGAHVAVALENARLFDRERQVLGHPRDARGNRARGGVDPRSSTSSWSTSQCSRAGWSITGRSGSCC